MHFPDASPPSSGAGHIIDNFPDASPPSSGAGHIIDNFPDASPPSSGAGHIIDVLPRCKSSMQWCRPHNRCTSQMQVLQAVVQAT